MAPRSLRLPFATAFAAGAACLALTFAAGCDPETKKGYETLTIAGPKATKTFQLKVAADDASRAKGLGGVTELPEDGGMIFIFKQSEARYFWMKGCVIDIDIAFLDGLGTVTAVHTMKKEAPQGPNESELAYENRLKRYNSGTPAQFAIELRPGTFDTLGIKRGSKIALDLPRLKALAK
jgi:uncharacterized membrane protein (UPF0127 family)